MDSDLTSEQWTFWGRWMQAHRALLQEVDRVLQSECDITKAEFSVLVSLDATSQGRMRVTELADSLGWEKSRVAHQLTRMERRGLLDHEEAGAAGRRTSITLTPLGRERVRRAVKTHSRTVRSLAFDRMSGEQIAAIASWSDDLLGELTPSGYRDRAARAT